MKRLNVIVFDMCRNVQTVLDEHLPFCTMCFAIIPKAFLLREERGVLSYCQPEWKPFLKLRFTNINDNTQADRR